jgi:hypothetical protein
MIDHWTPQTITVPKFSFNNRSFLPPGEVDTTTIKRTNALTVELIYCRSTGWHTDECQQHNISYIMPLRSDGHVIECRDGRLVDPLMQSIGSIYCVDIYLPHRLVQYPEFSLQENYLWAGLGVTASDAMERSEVERIMDDALTGLVIKEQNRLAKAKRNVKQ